MNAKKLVLIHIVIGGDNPDHVDKFQSGLAALLPDYDLVLVPNGQPCPTNPLPKITLVNGENKILMGAIKKICKQRIRPGMVVLLDKSEMDEIARARAEGEWVTL